MSLGDKLTSVVDVKGNELKMDVNIDRYDICVEH